VIRGRKGKDEAMDEKQNDFEEAEATVLPAREAMSIITPDTSAPYVPDLEPVEEATPGGADTAGGAASDAQGAASGEESTSSGSQSTQVSNQDSASSQT
jgi:hypothetical protein